MSRLKVFEVKEEKPLVDVEAMVEDFGSGLGKNGYEFCIEYTQYFESSFRRTHGVIVQYEEYPMIKSEPNAENSAVPEPEPAAAVPAGAGEGQVLSPDDGPDSGD